MVIGFFQQERETVVSANVDETKGLRKFNVTSGCPKRYSPSQSGFSIRIRRVFHRGRRERGGVFDLPIGLGRFHALQPTFLGLFSVIPIQLTKAVVENGSDVGPFSPLPIHLCALCGSPPHPDPKTFSDGL